MHNVTRQFIDIGKSQQQPKPSTLGTTHAIQPARASSRPQRYSRPAAPRILETHTHTHTTPDENGNPPSHAQRRRVGRAKIVPPPRAPTTMTLLQMSQCVAHTRARHLAPSSPASRIHSSADDAQRRIRRFLCALPPLRFVYTCFDGVARATMIDSLVCIRRAVHP